MQDLRSLTWKLEKKTTAWDIFVLPPCSSVFWLDCLRANYVSGISKRFVPRKIEILESQNHWWAALWRIHFVKMFPDNINEILEKFWIDMMLE